MSFSIRLTGKNLAPNTWVQLYKWHNWRNCRPELKHSSWGIKESTMYILDLKEHRISSWTSFFLLNYYSLQGCMSKAFSTATTVNTWPTCHCHSFRNGYSQSHLIHFTNSVLTYIVSALLKWNFLIKYISTIYKCN